MKIKNWHKFQHFKDRKPPWIKLYRDLLDDVEWFGLDGDDAKLLIMLWLIGSEDHGNLPAAAELAWRLRTTEKKLADSLGRLSHWIEPGENDALCDWNSRYISKELRETILERDGRKCLSCGSRQKLEIDHVVPISKGGDGSEANLQTLCRSCNRRKRARSHSYADAAQTRSLERETQVKTEKKFVASATSHHFLDFKKAYPKRKGDQGWPRAQKIFEAEIKSGADPATIISAAAKFREIKKDDEGTAFVPMARTWLHGRSWLEFVPTAEDAEALKRADEIAAKHGYRVEDGKYIKLEAAE